MTIVPLIMYVVGKRSQLPMVKYPLHAVVSQNMCFDSEVRLKRLSNLGLASTVVV